MYDDDDEVFGKRYTNSVADRFYGVPYEWEHLVCICISPYYGNPHEIIRNGESLLKCRLCSKVRRYLFAICQGCKEFSPTVFQLELGKRCHREFLCYSCVTASKPCDHSECKESDRRYMEHFHSLIPLKDIPPPEWLVKREPLDIQAVLSEEIDFSFDF